MSFVIAIAGGSCSGKTTLARHLQHRLGGEHSLLIRQDDYYHDIRDRSSTDEIPNFDVPEALDFELLAQNLSALKRGEGVSLPNYDFTTHQRKLPSEPIAARPYVIVEGILLLNAPQIRPLIDHSLYMQCSLEERFARRLARDVAERGRTEEFVHHQFYQEVEPAHQSYVAPSHVYADRIVTQDVYINHLTGLIDRIVDILPPLPNQEAPPQLSLAF